MLLYLWMQIAGAYRGFPLVLLLPNSLLSFQNTIYRSLREKRLSPRRAHGGLFFLFRISEPRGPLKITPLSCLVHTRFIPNPRTSSGQECRLRLKRPPPNAARRCLHLNPRPRSALLLLRPLSAGRFASLRFRPKNMAHHIFPLESELRNISEAPKASPRFSVSEKLARYDSSALSGV
jgi:hypothetical protein